jgi:general secretion pathway protein C
VVTLTSYKYFCYFFMSMKHYGIDHLLKHRSTVLLINIAAGLLLLAAVLFLVRDAISLSVSRKGAARVTESAVPPLRHPLHDYAVLMKNNPFGFAAGELTPLSSSSGPSISQTDLSLIGTIAGSRDRSYAIFSDKTGRQDIFKVGDDVFGLGTLKRVEKDNAVIHSNGKDMEIPFTDIAVVKDIGPGVPSPMPQLGQRTGSTSFVIDQQQIQQALARPDRLMTDARFIPNIVDGRQQGFTVREIKPGGIYQNLGLQNGDVLLRINDYTMSSPDTALQAITALKGIDRAQLDVIRHGARLTMTYQIR